MPNTQVYQAVATLTDAQIKTLPTAPFEIVPAPPAGKTLFFLAAHLVGDFSGGFYETPGSSVRITDSDGDQISIAIPANFFGFAQRYFVALTPITNISGTQGNYFSTNPANRALLLDTDEDQDYTGGHVDNTLTVTLLYTIIDV